MTITTPHQSQAGIAVAGGGRAADYAGESTFVTPGQRALPGALNQLAAGLDKLGGELHERAVKERNQLARAERLGHWHDIQEEFAQFQSDTRERHKLNEAGQILPAMERFFDAKEAEIQARWGHDPESVEYFAHCLGGLRVGGMTQSREYARGQQRLYVDGQWRRDLDDKAEAWSRPDVNDDMAGAIYGQIAAATVSLYGEGAEEGRVLENAYKQGRRASVQSRLLLEAANNPQAALKAVGLGGGGDGSVGGLEAGAAGEAGAESGKFDASKWGALPGIGRDIQKWYGPEEFLRLRERVAERIDSHYSAQMKRGTELLKTEQSRAEMDFYAKMSDGTLTPEDLESRRDLLSSEKYDKLMRGLKGESPITDTSDPATYIALNRLAVDAAPDFAAAAEEALKAGQISLGDYRALQAGARQRRSSAGKRVESALRALLGYNEADPAPEAAAGLAGVLREYDEWAAGKAGAEASDEQKHEMARRLAGDYWSAKVASLGRARLPLYLAGSRAAPDIDATLAETRRQFQSGGMSRAEYEKQCLAVRDLDRLIRRQRATDGGETRTRGRK